MFLYYFTTLLLQGTLCPFNVPIINTLFGFVIDWPADISTMGSSAGCLGWDDGLMAYIFYLEIRKVYSSKKQFFPIS